MRFLVLLPGFLGFAAVLQGGLNRQISGQWGLSTAALFNALVLCCAAGFLFWMTRSQPEMLPEFFRSRGGWSTFRWWFILPGLFGMALVVGIPWAISRVGAFPVFMGILAGQLITSLAWDAVMEQKPLTLIRLAGATLAFLGAYLVSRQN